jgi:hypothetical protein
MAFTPGERIRIVAGSYKKYKFGTYLRPAGLTKACVRVDGDDRQERQLWLTSLRKIVIVPPASAAAATTENVGNRAAPRNATITIDRDAFVAIIEDIRGLSTELRALEQRLNYLNI